MSTSPGFEPLLSARFNVDIVDGAEVFAIPAGRNWFVIPFLAVWLTMWTFGGIMAITQAMAGDAFLAIWLAFWALGWVFAASWIGWQIGGRTLLSAKDGAFVYRWKMPLVSRTKRYDASQIRNFGAGDMPWSFGGWGANMMRSSYPPFTPMQVGSIKFDYGARTVRVAPGLDEAEARMIVQRLRPKLPASAFSEPRAG